MMHFNTYYYKCINIFYISCNYIKYLYNYILKSIIIIIIIIITISHAQFFGHDGFVGYSLELRSQNNWINPLTPNDPYSGRTTPLTSKRCILYIYSTNIST